MSYPRPDAPVTWNGHTLDARTAFRLNLVEKKLGFKLHCFQGCFNAGGVAASAGTHDGGGAVDVSPYPEGDYSHNRADLIVRTLRQFGFAAWHRLPSQGPWGEHIHAIEAHNPALSSGAAQQVREYNAGQNGLANHGPDDGPRIALRDFAYPPKAALPLVNLRNVAAQARTGGPRKLIGVKRVQHALNTHGYGLTVDGFFGPHTKAAYAAYEKSIGGDGDGIPASYSLTKLGQGHFRVRKS